MKTAGIIGGIAPESTVEYYRLAVRLYRERTRDDSYPPILINSIDLTKMLGLIGMGQLPEVTDYLLGEIDRLARAGADFAALASNTPHIVFGALRDRSSIPLLSIVDATCQAAAARSLRRVGLFGTRFTMQASFYSEGLGREGIDVVVPSLEEQDFIHEKYMGELVKGVFRPETRERLLAIVERLRARAGIDGLILGGTELPLLLREEERRAGIPLLDTTRIHVEEIVATVCT